MTLGKRRTVRLIQVSLDAPMDRCYRAMAVHVSGVFGQARYAAIRPLLQVLAAHALERLTSNSEEFSRMYIIYKSSTLMSNIMSIRTETAGSRTTYPPQSFQL